VEREELFANFEQHQQLENKGAGREEKGTTNGALFLSPCLIPREEEAGCKLQPLLCCHVSWVDLSQGKKLEGRVAAVF